MAAQNGNEGAIQLLLAHEGVDVNRALLMGYTPLHIAAKNGHTGAVRLLVAHRGVDINRENTDGATPLLAAAAAHSTAAALALLSAAADPNARSAKGDTPLAVARRTDDAQLMAALVAAGADIEVLYSPLVAKCMLGDAHAARDVLLGSAAASGAPNQVPANTDDDDHRVPSLVAACLRGDTAALAELDCSKACEARADGLPPAFCFAVELGDAGVVAGVLSGAPGLDDAQ
eukprot:1413227-Prymnesium_polylepis.2